MAPREANMPAATCAALPPPQMVTVIPEATVEEFDMVSVQVRVSASVRDKDREREKCSKDE